MKKSVIDKFITYLEKECLNHSCYLWGGQGESVKNSTIGFVMKAETSANNAKRVLSHVAGLVNQGYITDDTKFFDCSGLVTYYLIKLGVLTSDTTANGIMTKCKKISKEDLKPGDFCFKVSDNKANHVGVYVGDNYVIESKGRDYGVVKLHIASNNWNAFGRL